VCWSHSRDSLSTVTQLPAVERSFSRNEHDKYTVGWICALPIEMAVAVGMLDERHDSLPQNSHDHNNYTLGRIGSHHVAIACLPAGVMGVTPAARVASQMRSTFPALRFGLMVGIGGGVPSEEYDIRLGDVVVSQPTGTSGGIIQYDFGKTLQKGRFEQTGSLNKPPTVLLNAVASLKAIHILDESLLSRRVAETGLKNSGLRIASTYPGIEHDKLFEADYDHPVGKASCIECDISRLVRRPDREGHRPVVHYGLVASGNQVMRDGRTRERLRREINVLCFEMEAAGLMDDFPCLVVRGICDYADSHKNKHWQPYAAATAAAYAKELLNTMSGGLKQVEEMALETVFDAQTVDAEPWMDDFHVPLKLGYSRNPSFTGRQEDLRYIYDFIEDIRLEKRANVPLVIYGTGGMGKTQLVREFTYAHQADFTSIIWIDGQSVTTIETSFLGFLQDLIYLYASRVTISRAPYAKVARHMAVADLVDKNGRIMVDQDVMRRVVDAVLMWLRRDGNRNWLLVFDSVDDLETFRISDYFPNSVSGNTILTSRRPECSRFGEGRILEVMSAQESVSLLSKSYGRKISLNDDGMHVSHSSCICGGVTNVVRL
jgi:nucleoside phosphorylase